MKFFISLYLFEYRTLFNSKDKFEFLAGKIAKYRSNGAHWSRMVAMQRI